MIMPIETPDTLSPAPLYRRGQLVRHRRYGYRGVVVEFDRECRANEQWYGSNRTQPDRNQPWYHVLVHGSAATTYAAQESLRADTANVPVEHSLLDQFFNGFFDGRHLRNEEPWPA